jgi:hypothetical protein
MNQPPSRISLIIRDHFASQRNVVEKGSQGEKEKENGNSMERKELVEFS